MEEAKIREAKRMTVQDEDGNWCIISEGNEPIKALNEDMQQAINRLALYENLGDDGRLWAFPCGVGSTIYVPWVYDGVDGIMTIKVNEINLYETTLTFTCYEVNSLDFEFLKTINRGVFNIYNYKKVWFTKKEQAEARLKELKEKHND